MVWIKTLKSSLFPTTECNPNDKTLIKSVLQIVTEPLSL